MSYTKEFAADAPGGFKGAWYYKPWYVKRSHFKSPEPTRPEGMLHGAKGLEWPEYPGAWKPRWEDRAGVPGLYKPGGTPPGSYPATKFWTSSPRQRWRGSALQFWALVGFSQLYSFYWMKNWIRFKSQLRDEEKFHRFACTSYLQAFNDCRNYNEASRFDRFCREHVDHLPGIDRNFYHQEDLFFPWFYEMGPAMREDNYGNASPWAPWYQAFVGA